MEKTLSVYFINETNLNELKRLYHNGSLLSSASRPEFKIGNVLVVKTTTESDLFDGRFGVRNENVWIATRSELDEKFDIVDDEHKTESFAIITLK